ncbi:HMA2 domain-containing protein [Nitrosococcus wardiae]|uniref:Heavy-metal-associated domain-containing protein n=1 Tax=Nitrosococcus wardiae TaxID=1814290 RepID=A0A4P7C0E6_9GAMM|nr:cation transporter [Nitrosococcus wardiae]QBQ55901.1 heavy-metal-associated domain-containing protein [Nitrosococcus wardiae]
MVQYVHYVPGRLRVKLASLKRNPIQAAAIEGLLKKIEGVDKAEINLVTGSLIVTYDRAITHPQGILQALHDHGFCRQLVTIPLAGTASSKQKVQMTGKAVGQVGERFGKAVLDVVVEKVLERSAVVLIGAIL